MGNWVWVESVSFSLNIQKPNISYLGFIATFNIYFFCHLNDKWSFCPNFSETLQLCGFCVPFCFLQKRLILLAFDGYHIPN